MSSNLDLSQVAASQNQKEVTINDAFGQVDAALTEFLALDLSAGDVTVTGTQARRAMLLRVSGNAVARTLTLPQLKREIAVQNQGSAQLTIKRGTATIPLEPGTLAKVYLDGTANGLMVSSGVSEAKFIRLSDAPSSYVGQAGKIPKVKATEDGLFFDDAGAGVTDFLDLTDTPDTYAGAQGKVLRVNPAGSAIEFGDMPQAGGFRGALVDMTANLTGVAWPIGVPFNRARYDSSRFWLGPDLTFTADAATDQITAVGHGMASGEGPFYLTTTGALPAGLAANTKYWAIRVGADVLKLAASKADALAGTAIDITSAGTGTHTLARGRFLVIPANVPRVRISAAVEFESNVTAAGSVIITIHKNSADFSASVEPAYGTTLAGQRQSSTGFNNNNASLVTGVIEVAEGDTYAIRANVSMSGQDQILASARTFFAIEVVEAFGGVAGTLPIEQGGTGATDQAGARANLGALAKAGDTMTGDLLMQTGARITTGGGPFAGVSGVVADIQSNSPSAAGLAAVRWSNDPSPPRFMLAKSRGAGVGTHAAVAANDVLGELSYAGSSGSGMVAGATIDAIAQGAGAAGGVAAALRFFTSAGGAATERMRVDQNGLQMGGANLVIDAQRIPRLRSYTRATLPAASSAPQGVVDCSDLGGGAGPLYSDGTTWQRLQELSSYASTGGDTNATVSVLGNASVVTFTANLTADRTVTLSTSDAYLGAMKRIIYAGNGAGRLICGGITLRPGCWADFMWTGSAWTCVGAGARNDAMQVYETGTWTPTLYGNTTAGTQTMHANNSGNYIRVGQTVVAVAYIQWSAIDAAAAGDVVIGGLPFPAANLANNLPTAAVTAQTITYPAGQTQLIARFRGPNGTTVSLIFSGPGTGQAFTQMSQLSAAGVISFTIVYRTN
ncbi:hypothetical protein KXS07_23665 [Inquilinus limosus]|uniref:hypothetical protein n=1 Tax=Inquilinus limosus TaxID=171674 RepID=UPI003F13FCB3